MGNSDLGASAKPGRRFCGNRVCHTTGEYEVEQIVVQYSIFGITLLTIFGDVFCRRPALKWRWSAPSPPLVDTSHSRWVQHNCFSQLIRFILLWLQKYREAYYIHENYWMWVMFMREVYVYHIELWIGHVRIVRKKGKTYGTLRRNSENWIRETGKWFLI